MEPINLNNNDNRSGSSKGINLTSLIFTKEGKPNWIGIIILLVIVVIYFNNSSYETQYDSNIESNNSSNYIDNTQTITQNNSQNNTENINQSSTSNDSSSSSLLDLLFGGGSSSSTNNSDYEDTTIKNVSKDKYTLMIYMCGSNLESNGGYGSADIEEMLKSTIADEVTVLIYTGGARRWFDYGISNRTNQIYTIKNHKLVLVKDNLGLENMADSRTLEGFLKFGKQNYPADKYALIMWDHGGGAVTGFGLDENTGKGDNLTIDEIKTAVDNFGTKLEFVGFDACLMANFETAYALKDGANYLIASEETEPGTGWNYVKIFNTLSKDSSQAGSVTGKTIVDSFIESNSAYRNPDATLSVMDLKKIDNLYKALVDFMKEIKTQSFDKNKYNQFSKVVTITKAFGEGTIDTIDLIHFARNMEATSSSKLVQAAQEAVAYNKTNQYVENSNGISIFIPYRKLSSYDKMLRIYKNIGMGSDYTNVLTQYVNAVANGQKPTYTVNNHSYTQSQSNYSDFSWFDLLFASRNMSMYEETKVDAQKLEVQDKGDYFSLHLSKSDWENITKVESVVWYDAGKGYVDMGSDSYFTQDSEGDLKVEFDGTWLAINGDNICYEVIERTSNYEKGKVPCVINGERSNIILYFDKQNPDGEVLGYEPDYEYLDQMLYEKGLRTLKKGDKVDFVASYYSHDGKLDDEFYINDTLVIGDEPLKISYESLGDNECLVYYRLTDVYNNVYYTEPVILE